MKSKHAVYEPWIDLGRIFGALAVIAIHASASVVLNQELGSKTWWLANIINSFSRWAVPVFVIISGYLIIDKPTPSDFKKYYTSRLRRVIPALLFWTALYYWLITLVIGRSIPGTDLLKQLYNGNPEPGHLYFLFIIIGLYLVAPFVSLVTQHIKLKHVIVLCGSLLLATTVWFSIEFWVLRGGSPVNLLTQWIPYLGYFIAGFVIKKVVSRLPLALILISSLLSALSIAVFSYFLIQNYGIQKGLYLYDFLSPATMLFSLSVFLLFQRFQSVKLSDVLTKYVKLLGSLSFGVYLVHILVLWKVGPLCQKIFENVGVSMVVSIVLTAVISFVIVYIITKIPLLKRVVE